MYTTKLITGFMLLMCLGTIIARKVKRKDFHYQFEVQQHTQSADPYAHTADSEPQYVYHKTKSSIKSGYSSGTGLRSIAQGSADQATSAVANQHAAAKQASYVAQSTLAQAATQAATTALAALKGKEVLLQRLQQQSLESHHSFEDELTQLQQAKRSAKAAQQSAQQAINHVSVLTAALNNAQIAAEHAQQSATEAAAELSSQTQMVGQAKQKLEQLEHQLDSARLDYEATRSAAEQATSSAQEAQNNAAEAALHASIGLHESAIAASTANGSYHSEQQEVASNHNYGEPPHQHHTYRVSDN